MKIRRVLLFLIISLVFIQLVGCSGKQEENKESKGNQSSPPNSLTDINMSVEKIITKLEEGYEKVQEEKKSKDKESKSNQDNSQNKSSKKDESKANQDSSNNEKKMKDLEKTLTESWEKVNKEIKSLHQNWNSYESEELIDKQKINSIEGELNDLTEISNDEKLLATLLKINQFNLEIAELYSNYNAKIKTLLKKVEAYTRDIMYLSFLTDTENNIDKQIEDIDKIKELLPQIELKFEKDQKMKSKVKELNKAVEDLEQAVKEQKKEVIKVKGELILQKLKELDEAK
ncbi:hypothetical protein BX659_105145 [Orenia metallireducens]|jgi:hypothetical protein|uniref:Uncharacterized protein n=1 Tax=Orenia metallireducens TaxID=1413210 RepID=A0A285G4V7_9FIRM|nr:hypothetical protein [Orenia metallireducens]PRX31814.1 hypothetical protein BX659_105145 [Orenia metallireducens]SNY17461.1 hypothetical protein SAMN06265827_104145 [Orenia metallireducens]